MSLLLPFYFVDLIPCLDPFMCPFWISSDSGIYLFTTFTLRSIHIVQFPAHITFIHISFTRNPATACRYFIVSLVTGSLNPCAIASVGSVQSMLIVLTFLLSIAFVVSLSRAQYVCIWGFLR